MSKKSPVGLGTAVIWSDEHHPHTDKVAHSAVYQFTRRQRPDYEIHIGDCLDLPGISRWVASNLKAQYEEKVIGGLESLGTHFNHLFKINPKGHKVWLMGNHEARLDAFVEEHPSWAGICDDVVGLLEIYGKCPRASEIEVVRLTDFEDDWSLGKMHFAHGFSACKHVAAKHVEEYDESITFGHAHTMQMHSTTKRTVPRQGYCIGHMMNREGRRYLKGRASRWVTGFAFMEYDRKTGEFTQHLLPIVNGKFRFAGRTYDGNA